jgi:hypothetical protein
MSKVSDCCGAAPIGNGDISYEDVGICSSCKEHCDYIEEGADDDWPELDPDRNRDNTETPLGEQIDSQGEIE